MIVLIVASVLRGDTADLIPVVFASKAKDHGIGNLSRFLSRVCPNEDEM
jgi:hypothetical protein